MPSQTPDARPVTLVCVPGLGLEDDAWRPTLGRLAGRPAEVVTLPGYGERPRRGDDPDPVALGSRLVRERLGGRSGLVLAGHSASCQVVVEAALAAPDAVLGLVLVGPTTDPRAVSWRALAGRWLRTAAHERPGQVPLLLRSYSRVGLAHMGRTMDAARRHDVRAPLAVLDVPVLVVRGRHDAICPVDWAEDLARIAPPSSRATSLPRGAHMVPVTHGDLTALAVRDFLDRVDSSRG